MIKPADLSRLRELLLERGLRVDLVSDYCQENRSFGDCLPVAYGNRSLPELEALVHALAEFGRTSRDA